MRVDMKSADMDLFSKLLSLSEKAREDLLDFFGDTNMSQAQINDLQEAISASIAMKNRSALKRAH